MTSLRTPAWRLIGLTRNQPGLLDLADGRLAFTPLQGEGFDVPLAEVTGVTFPWYYIGGGVKLKAAGEAYRFSFVRPNGAEHVPARLVPREYASDEDPWEVEPGMGEVARGRRVGTAWKAALGSRG